VEYEFLALIAVLSIPMGIGFALGYGVRSMISHRRQTAVAAAWLQDQNR
jgi:hypothetical protein